jgi:hypothetical protein
MEPAMPNPYAVRGEGAAVPGVDANTSPDSATKWRWVTIAVLGATVAQLAAAATFASRLPQFEAKGFGVRLVAYPALMLSVPAIWALVRRARARSSPLPWAGFALIMVPFLIDVSGNSANLYDTLLWWDDANHLVNWAFLCAGVGLLLLRAAIEPTWALGLVIAGLGALLAIGWELAEWYTFIRHGTELDTAYTDTLGDLALSSLGGCAAAVLVVRYANRRTRELSRRAPEVP